MKKVIILITLVVCVVLYACRHLPPDTVVGTGVGPGGIGPSGNGSGGNAHICFSTDILPLFQQYCATASCHSANSTDPLAKRYILDSYAHLFLKDGQPTNNNIRAGYPNNSDLYKVMTAESLTSNKRMPRPPFSSSNPDLTVAQKNLISQWILEGATNTTCTPSAPCDTTQFTYTNTIKPILTAHCIGCHSPGAGSILPGGYNFNLYADAHRAAITNYPPGLLYAVVAHLPGFNPMPQGAGAPLSTCEITQIKKWVNAGGPNN
jgi:mono/diheme cytochrome c family protein